MRVYYRKEVLNDSKNVYKTQVDVMANYESIDSTIISLFNITDVDMNLLYYIYMADIDIQKNFLTFIKSKNVAALSTVSTDGQPMSATIYYIVDDDFTFYFMAKKTRKIENIQSNNKVALLISRENAPITAQIHGIAEQIHGNSHFDMKRDELIKSLLHTPFSPPIFEIAGDDVFIYKITPTWIRWFDLTDKSGNRGFKQILP